MGYGFNKSDLIKEKWEAAYYGQVMNLLIYIGMHGAELVGASCVSLKWVERAVQLASLLSEYAKVSRADADAPSHEMTVYVSLFHREYRDIAGLMGYGLGGGVPGWDMPEVDSDEVAGYFLLVAERSRQYFAESDCKAAEAARLAEEKCQERQREREHKVEREGVLLQRIRDYVAECEAKGEKPVKKCMVDEEFTQNIVSKVWKRFEAERLT